MNFDSALTKTYDFFIKLLQSIDLEKMVLKVISILVIFLIASIVYKISVRLVDKLIAKQKKFKVGLDEKRVKTISIVLKSFLKYTIYFFAFSAVLYQFFGAISLTFASIGGVAIGLGAQNLIKDVVNGFFMVFEDQFSVGDYIHIADKGGVVQSIGLRLTKLKDFNGDVHIIPNGSVGQITNHCRSDMRVLVDVDIAYEEDIDRVTSILEGVCEEFKGNDQIVEGPKVLGVSALKDSGVTFSIWATTKPMAQWECEREIRKHVKKALDREGVEIPYPKRTVYHVREE
ncbi:MAG: mechanosensitive ion channel family protein [Clostridium sp.]|uniref:mechanosensitive ion channel family protein n=1 Tax=Clostridium sp. TaxID=1506 RepID=UPI002A8D454E|nr:mechanosensitive ion channel family protein [Clostridium sp.]MDY5096635.1 mechanosensitive ion channel family protein [Clostridium sp.]